MGKANEKIIIKDVRASYVFADTPRQDRKKDGSIKIIYSMQPLIPKDHPQLKAIKGAIWKVAKEAFGPNVKPKMLKLPLRDGDEERDSEEYNGVYFMNANNKKKPGIVNRKGKHATEKELDELCYSGCYFHISVTFFDFEEEGNRGVAVALNNIMLRKEGDRLDGHQSAENEFSEFAEEDEDDWGDDWDDEKSPHHSNVHSNVSKQSDFDDDIPF